MESHTAPLLTGARHMDFQTCACALTLVIADLRARARNPRCGLWHSLALRATGGTANGATLAATAAPAPQSSLEPSTAMPPHPLALLPLDLGAGIVRPRSRIPATCLRCGASCQAALRAATGRVDASTAAPRTSLVMWRWVGLISETTAATAATARLSFPSL